MSKTLAVLIIVLHIFASPSHAGEPGMIWVAEGRQNTVYLLGSIHLLREADYPLPETIDLVYKEVDAIVMELDMDDIDAVEAIATMRELGVLDRETRLKDLLGEELQAQAAAAAEATDIPLELLQDSEPWLAAITVQELLTMRLGYEGELGIENYIGDMAYLDGKPIFGLETIGEQLGFLDGLPMQAQSEWLVHSLVDGLRIEMLVDELVKAWRSGDVDYLERELIHEAKMSPEVHDAILLQRNFSWIDKIVALMDDDQDYLVVVGAAHLVGDDGLIDLLTERDIAVARLGISE